MFELSIKTRFSAAHHLKDYHGSCAALHGHNWEVEVFVRGEELDDAGILMDFREMKATVARALADLDHSDLNEHDAFKGRNPTSENIAKFLFDEMSGLLDGGTCCVHRVSVKETAEATAIYWES